MDRRSSRSVKFARALIVASGLVGLGCGRVGLIETPITPSDAGGVDAGALADAGTRDAGTNDAGPFTCPQCDCGGLSTTLPRCDAVNHGECCFAVGPLAPPELPTLA